MVEKSAISATNTGLGSLVWPLATELAVAIRASARISIRGRLLKCVVVIDLSVVLKRVRKYIMVVMLGILRIIII